MENNSQPSNTDKFQWIREIIRANVVAKLRGKSFANVLDIGVNTGTLLTQLRDIFKDSRFYAYLADPSVTPKLSEDVRIMKHESELTNHRYDLILSVFDIHSLNWLNVNEFVKLIHKVSDDETTILFSDISANTFISGLMLKLGSFFNPRLKSVISQSEAVEMLKERGFKIIDKDEYKINDVWSAWILTCKKTNMIE